MTAIQYVEYILENDWAPNIDGRWNEVPKPEILREATLERQRMSLDTADYAVIQDGGAVSYEGQGLGWTEEDVTARVTVDLRTSGIAGKVDGRVRLIGERDESNAAERYGGLSGEVKRICDKYRRGDQEFDLINGFEFNDLSSQMPGSQWRGTVEIRLEERAKTINPSEQL